MNLAEILFGGVLALGCLGAMASDLARRLIPNSLCLVLAAVGLGYGYSMAGLPGLGWHAVHMTAAFAIGLGLFAIRWAGGGDGKFYAACAAWFPARDLLPLLSLIAMAGLVLVFVWFAVRKLRGQETFGLRSGKAVYLPFGVAIGCGTLALYALRA